MTTLFNQTQFWFSLNFFFKKYLRKHWIFNTGSTWSTRTELENPVLLGLRSENWNNQRNNEIVNR